MSRIIGEIDFNKVASKTNIMDMKDMILKKELAFQTAFYDEYVSFISLNTERATLSYFINNKNYVIVFDGEIYNKKQICSDLKQNEEILLYAYDKWGIDCLNKIDGVFSFVIWDKDKIFFARDKMGVKPFFYNINNKRLLFASEIKGLLGSKYISREIDLTSIMEILLIGPGRTSSYGVFKDISSLEPASYGVFTKDNLFIDKYWSLTDGEFTHTFDECKTNIKNIVLDSIDKMLDNNFENGTMLSGGLDSSLIASVLNQKYKQNDKTLKTFSVTYEDHDKHFVKSDFQTTNDNVYIKQMNNYLDTKHYNIVLGVEDLAQTLFSAVEARDLPGMADIDTSLLLFCNKIKEECDSVFSGECSDEIFGGYPWYQNETIRNAKQFPWSKSIDFKFSFLNDELKTLVNPYEYVNEKYNATINQSNKLNNDISLDNRIKEMVNLNYNWFMQTLLERGDRMSTISNLNINMPFCDCALFEYLYKVPWEYKNHKGYEKGLLRSAMEGYLPEEVLWRKKSPYPKTHNPKYLNIVSKLLLDELSNSVFTDIFDKNKLIDLIKDDSKVPWYGQLMTTPQTIGYFVQISYWLRKYNIKVNI